MQARASEIRAGSKPELLWLLEHPPLYTSGTSANKAELLNPEGFPVFAAGRGGRYTYHGPGQRVAYVQIDLRARGGDIRAFVQKLEEWLILTCADFGVCGERRAGRIGIWVEKGGREEKIAALGVRVQRGITLHGISLNVAPDLNHFSGIIPCGIKEFGVTSFEKLGVKASMQDIDAALCRHFASLFQIALSHESE